MFAQLGGDLLDEPVEVVKVGEPVKHDPVIDLDILVDEDVTEPDGLAHVDSQISATLGIDAGFSAQDSNIVGD